MRRRRFITATAGTVLTAGLAGCLGGDGGPDTGSPTAVVESWYNSAAAAGDADKLLEVAKNHYHSQSPLLEFMKQNPQDGPSDEVTIESLETTVSEEDLSTEDINNLLEGFGLEDETVSELANAENARVAVDLEQSGQTIEEEQVSNEHFVVKEDDDWLIFA